MNKFNRKFNNSCMRFSFWNDVAQYFCGFERLLRGQDILTHEDIVILRKIHTLLYQCSQEAKERREIYQRDMGILVGTQK